MSRASVSSSRAYANPEAAALSGQSAHVKGAEQAETKSDASALSSQEIQQWTALLSQGLATHAQESLAAYAPNSQLEESRDPCMYEGVVGAAYMSLHVATQLSATQLAQKQAPQSPSAPLAGLLAALPASSLQYAQRAAELLAHAARHSRRALPPTFYCGSGGVWATLALAALHSGSSQHSLVEQSVVALLQEVPRAREDASLPYEILYGRAGYMHALLLVHHALSADSSLPDSLRRHISPLQRAIDELFRSILQAGQAFPHKLKGCPLMWEWHGKMYLGAAHGVTGILYLLLLVHWCLNASDEGAQAARQLICGTLDYCISIRLQSGNFPSSEAADPDNDPADKLVQWCHGAPGLSLACIKAFEVWGDEKYLQVARESAEVVWERGLLKKGVGLCHGVGGNGYVFLRLFDATGDLLHLRRALSFCRFALQGSHAADLLAQPDCPYSLANGRAGFACFVADTLAQVSRLQQEGGESGGGSKSSPRVRASFPGMDMLA